MNLCKFGQKLRGCPKSCVMRVNAAFAVLAPGLDYAQMQIPLLQAYLPEHIYGWAFGIILVANVIMRFRTKEALEHK